jgi:hypothetical protein
MSVQCGVVDSHQQYINTEALVPNVPDMDKRLSAIESVQVAQAEEARVWDEQLELLLEKHQLSVRQTSVSLLRCDALITAMEKRRRALTEVNK